MVKKRKSRAFSKVNLVRNTGLLNYRESDFIVFAIDIQGQYLKNIEKKNYLVHLTIIFHIGLYIYIHIIYQNYNFTFPSSGRARAVERSE